MTEPFPEELMRYLNLPERWYGPPLALLWAAFWVFLTFGR